MDKQNRHSPHSPKVYFRGRPTLKTVNRPTKRFIFRKQRDTVNVSYENICSVINYDVKLSASGCSCLCVNEITSHEFGKILSLRAGNSKRPGSMRRKFYSSKTITKSQIIPPTEHTSQICRKMPKIISRNTMNTRT